MPACARSPRARPLSLFNLFGWLAPVNACLFWMLAILPACAPAGRGSSEFETLLFWAAVVVFALSMAFGWIGARSASGRAQTAAILGLFMHVVIVMCGFALAIVIGALH